VVAREKHGPRTNRHCTRRLSHVQGIMRRCPVPARESRLFFNYTRGSYGKERRCQQPYGYLHQTGERQTCGVHSLASPRGTGMGGTFLKIGKILHQYTTEGRAPTRSLVRCPMLV